MPHPRHIFSAICTPLSLTRTSEAKLLLDVWQEYFPNLQLDEAAINFFRRPFAFSEREVISHWKPDTFFAIKQEPWIEWMIKMRVFEIQQHATWLISADFDALNIHELEMFLEAAATKLIADFSCITVLTEEEIREGVNRRTVFPGGRIDGSPIRIPAPKPEGESGEHFWRFMIHNPLFRGRLPDIYWKTILGRRYVEQLGRDKILDCGASVVKELAPELISLKVVADIEQMWTTPSEFQKKRNEIKRSLGERAFYAGDEIDMQHAPFR